LFRLPTRLSPPRFDAQLPACLRHRNGDDRLKELVSRPLIYTHEEIRHCWRNVHADQWMLDICVHQLPLHQLYVPARLLVRDLVSALSFRQVHLALTAFPRMVRSTV
jgi:hypothetical protein